MTKANSKLTAPFTLETVADFRFEKVDAQVQRHMPLTSAVLSALFPPPKVVARYHIIGCRKKKR